MRAWESLLPYARPPPIDLFWVRIPLMLLALGLVLFWQYQKQAQHQHATLLGGGGGRRGLFGGGGGGGGGRRRWRGRLKDVREEEEDDLLEEEDDDEELTQGIGVRPPGQRGYEVGGDSYGGEGAGGESEELRYMRAALQEVRGKSTMEEHEMEEMLRREQARIERWR